MIAEELLNRIRDLPPRSRTEPSPPPLEVVACVVRWCRHLRQWKVSTLADFARVSTTTVERVERAEKVSNEALDRIALALGYDLGAFHAPRIPLSESAALEQMIDTYSNMVSVPVRRFSTHSAVREAASCQAFLIHRPGVPDAYDDDIHALIEWLDFASFVMSDWIETDSEGVKRRKLYDDILAHAREMERRGLTVLSGAMDAPEDGLPDWKVAIISVTPRLTDPGAVKRNAVLVDRRGVSMSRAGWLSTAEDCAAGQGKTT